MNVVDTLKLAQERVLACVGVNDIGVARLRLMMRIAGPELTAQWRMGEPDEADLLVLAAGNPRADRIALDARSNGVHYLLLGGRRGDPGVLPMPFDAADLVTALNADAPRTTGLELLDSNSPDFFLGAAGADVSSTHEVQRRRLDPVDMDELFKRDPLSDRTEVTLPARRQSTDSRLDELVPTVAPREPAKPRNPFLDDDSGDVTASEAMPSTTRSNSWVLSDTSPRHAPASADSPRSRAPVANGHPLSAYLDNGLLVGPSRLQLPGQAELVLDPKHGVYHIEGDLKAAEAYVREPLSRDAWRPVTNTQLKRVREASPAQPWVRLRWLSALRQAGGWLPKHLDPGGAYWLRQTLELDDHYDVYRRIGRLLMQSHRLHELVQAAKVDMKDVFDTVAAYDAIGMVRFTPRERLR